MPSRLEQSIAVEDELRTSIRLIHSGFGQLQLLDGANDFYHLPLLALSGGFERLMKVIICFRHLEVNGEFPSREVFARGSKGHSLERLLKQVRDDCFLSDCISQIPVAKIDLEYLLSSDLLDFVGILSQFGQAARYHNLNVVLGVGEFPDSPENAWQELESAIVVSAEGWLDEMISNPGSNEVGERVIREIVVRLERFARALCRLFTIGRIGKEAQRYLGVIGSFVFLDDSFLGTKKYCPVGTSA